MSMVDGPCTATSPGKEEAEMTPELFHLETISPSLQKWGCPQILALPTPTNHGIWNQRTCQYLFYSWYLLPHPSGSGSKLCPHGSIMEIFPCPDLFPLCITSPIVWAHIFIGQNQFPGLSGFKTPFSHTLSSFQPFPKGQGQAERELLNQYCFGLNALWNCTSDFLCGQTDPYVDYFSASFLVAGDLLHQTLAWLPLLSIAEHGYI